MRLILTLFVALVALQFSSAQLPQVEMRLTEGSSSDLVDVQLRALGNAVSSCDAAIFITNITYSVVWDNASGITDVNAIPTGCGCGSGFGLESADPVALSDGSDRSGVLMQLNGLNPCVPPVPFDLPSGNDNWVTIMTLQVIGPTPDGSPLSAGGLKITDVGDPGIPAGQNAVWEASISQFSFFTYTEDPWTLTVIEGSLPVTLMSFEAVKQGDRSVRLEWATADEYNTSHFVIERSRDGKEWEDLGSVDAAGESVETLNYTFIDKNAYNGRSAQARFYYRLRMIDNDASFSRSEIEAVVFKSEGPGSEVYAYPNPSSIGLNVEFNAQERVPSRMELFDASGRVVYSTVLAPGTDIEYIDYSRLSITSGTYILRVSDQNEDTMSTDKIIVSR